MGSPEKLDKARVEEESVLSGKRRVVEEVLVGPSVLEHEGEPSMVADHERDAAIEYVGYQALISRTVDVFGDEMIASRWLSMPSPDFDGKVPIYVAQDLGYDPLRVQEVFEPVFIRIEHGIYL